MPAPSETVEEQVARFLATTQAKGLPDTIYLGIDPGLRGALALLQKRRTLVFDMPVIRAVKSKTRKLKNPQPGGPKTQRYKGSDDSFDDAAILRIFRLLRPFKEQIVVALEKALVQGRGGARESNTPLTAWRTGAGWGMWPLFLKSKGFQVHSLVPVAWKKKAGLTGKDKEASRALALSLYPKADVTRKKDHDRAEALLMAHFLRIELEGGAR